MITFSALGKNGRLGNMIFQLSTSISTALRNNDQYIFPSWSYEPYFNLHNCFSNNINPTKIYTEPYFNYSPIPFTNTTNEVLDLSGYWQSHLYFDHCQDLIRQLFTPNYNIEPQLNTTSIHIRRTDYLKFADYHTNLDMNYYQQAMSLCPSEKYYVFSDDINWCKSQFIGNQFTFIEGHHETYDLCLMSKCVNNIIANSSFSWWAGWLNANPDKKVIAPKNWFGHKLQHNTKDLIPESWIQI
jgi:hypothetical protein